jgi:transaldolase
VQRLLWASTGTKNPAYAETMYVEGLIAAHTVNTMPPATLQAFVREGRVRPSLEPLLPEADALLRQLPAQGIDLQAITTRLQEEGIAQFEQSFAALLARIESRRVA